MSYEPIIYIRKNDLEKFRKHIENAEYDTIPKKKFTGRKAVENRNNLIEAYSELQKALNDTSSIKFPELEIVTLHVDITSKNGNVRELLNEIGIEYWVEN